VCQLSRVEAVGFGIGKDACDARTNPATWHAHLRGSGVPRATEKLEAGPKYKNQELVFATPTGRALNLRNVVNRHFKPILEAAKLPKAIRRGPSARGRVRAPVPPATRRRCAAARPPRDRSAGASLLPH